MAKHFNLRAKIEEGFKPYDDTLGALRQLVKMRRMAQELIILVCARLDSLANLAFGRMPQEERFFRFLNTYSGQRDTFEDVSIPDLYFFLRFQQDMLPGTLVKPGRIHVYTEENLAFVRILWKSGLAINRRSASRLLEYLHETLREHYRVNPSQNRRKPQSAKVNAVLACFTVGAKGLRAQALQSAEEEIRATIKRFQLGRILYRDYRCASIHEYGVSLDEDMFFAQDLVYWRHFTSKLTSERFSTVEFPSQFLLTSLKQCLRNYKRALRERQRLPMPIFNVACSLLRDLEYLDDDSIGMGKDISLSVERGLVIS